jgi:hypothetical protein
MESIVPWSIACRPARPPGHAAGLVYSGQALNKRELNKETLLACQKAGISNTGLEASPQHLAASLTPKRSFTT